MNPLQYLLGQLGRLHNETAILEACDWDEENVETLLSNLNTMPFDPDAPLTDNLKKFCESQAYISEYNRENLYAILEQAIIIEVKELAIAEEDEEYEN